MYLAECIQDWKKYISYGDKLISKYDADLLDVYNWAIRINKNCDDQKLRNHAAVWCDKYAAQLEQEAAERAAQEAKGGMTMAMRMGPQGQPFHSNGNRASRSQEIKRCCDIKRGVSLGTPLFIYILLR